MNAEIKNNKWTKEEVEQCVILTRLSLYNRELPCGSKTIIRKLEEEYGVTPLPSQSTVARILTRQGLTHKRTGFYEGE